MIVKRVLDTTLTIDDFQILRSKNIDNVIFNIINDKFNNICYRKCFILEVLRIINIGDIESNQNDVQNCSFNVNVLFEVNCEYFQNLEPVLNMKILSIRNNSLTLGSKNKIAVMKPSVDEKVSDLIKGFKEGDYYPVRSGRAIFEPVSNKIKIGCVSYFNNMNKELMFDLKSSEFIKKYIINNENFDIKKIIETVSNFEIPDKNKILSLDKQSIIQKLQPYATPEKKGWNNLLEDLINNKIINAIEEKKEMVLLLDMSDLSNVRYKLDFSNDKKDIAKWNDTHMFMLMSDIYIFTKQIEDFNKMYSEDKIKIILQKYLNSL